MASSQAPQPMPAFRQTPFSSVTSSTSHVPPGTFVPGTKVQVGSHRVVIEKYLSEGGFAHVYLVRVPLSGGKTETAVLKRVAVPDKEALANMRTEVETMKKLRGHQRIVTYIDSHASQLKGGGYEVFLLMEYCNGGGLIDFMNTRLKNRLTEPEVLEIFSDAAEGVACMHYLKPPLLHRDLKVENVLITTKGSSKVYKLCDFGSSAPPRPAATTAAEGRLIDDDVQKHTTLQYRSPEMIDVYRKQPIEEKSDIWALGVLLYKLCYYTTPFEEQGQMAILTASFKFPGHPRFSDRLKKLIAHCLQSDPKQRPNIYEVICEVCTMRGKKVPIKDIYSARSPEEAKSHQRLPSPERNINSQAFAGAYHAAPEPTKQDIPEITPMRRGRQRPNSQNIPVTQASKAERDPFAALDSPSFSTRSKAVDELSAKFPSAEQFSLLQDQDSRFQFDTGSDDRPLNNQVTNALADEVFAKSPPPPRPEIPPAVDRATSLKKTATSRPAKPAKPSSKIIHDAVPNRPHMVSTGTMTSPTSSPIQTIKPAFEDRPIWRVPASQPGKHEAADSLLRPVTQTSSRTNSLHTGRNAARSPASSRPSLEGIRPTHLNIPNTVHRSRSADEQSLSPTKPDLPETNNIIRSHSQRTNNTRIRDGDELHPSVSGVESNIRSNVDFLRAMEEEDSLGKGHHQRASSLSRRIKHTSMPSVPKNVLTGKFSNAFRRFEGSGSGQRLPDSEATHTTSETESSGDDEDRQEPVQTAYADDAESAIDETEDLSPEMRRELERRRLSMEEKRVNDAAVAYRQQLANGARGSSIKASAIQNRVKSLLSESERTSPVRKTAEGYGKYTEVQKGAPPLAVPESKPTRQPLVSDGDGQRSYSLPQTFVPEHTQQSEIASRPVPVQSSGRNANIRPTAPPKPKALRTGGPTPLPVRDEGLQPAPVTEDWETDFSKRYPSLSLEMVETEIATSQKQPTGTVDLRIKDV